ncbi:MAG TPA: c-type cytochrome domain-containing protein [Pirellulales bacterium]|nr:c-type cytochrome domain-containing protein [Pirellulales bacterium]
MVKRCETCHGGEKAESSYRLDTWNNLQKKGDNDVQPLVPGQPDTSELLRLIESHDARESMPKKAAPLSAAQQSLFRRWIAEGAKFDADDPGARLATLIPAVVHPAPPENYPVPAAVAALAFAPDGAQLAAGGQYEITLWDPADGRLLRRVPNMARRTYALAYSPDGTSLFAAGGDPGQSGEVRQFDLADGHLIRELCTLADVALDVQISPNGKRVAVAAADRTVRVFERETGHLQFAAEVHADWVSAVCWSADGAQLATASRDKTAKLLDAKNGGVEATVGEGNQAEQAVAFLPDGKSLIVAGQGKLLSVWQIDGNKKTNEIRAGANETDKLLRRDNDLFACGADRAVRLFDLKNKSLLREFLGAGDSVFAMALSADGQRLAAGTAGGQVLVWNPKDGKVLSSFIAAPGWKDRGGR